MIDKQATEVLLQLQGRKAEEVARKRCESALSEDKFTKKELELKMAQDIMANNNSARK